MSKPWRILVTGSRTWDAEGTLRYALNTAAAERPDGTDLIIVHGDCKHGADAMADRWARDYGFRVERHPAEWPRFGKRAGFIRNQVMVEAGVDQCVALIRDCSPGATHCADLAEKAGIPVRRFTATTPVLHVIYCRGCRHAWYDGDDAEPNQTCACTCTDDRDPRYEDWVTDPDPADVPEGAWS